jgi:hypothetical protein
MFNVKALGAFDQLIIDGTVKLMRDAGLLPRANDTSRQAIDYVPCVQNTKRFHKIRSNCHQLTMGRPTPVAASVVAAYLGLSGTPDNPNDVSLGQFIEQIDTEILDEPLFKSVGTQEAWPPLLLDNMPQLKLGKETEEDKLTRVVGYLRDFFMTRHYDVNPLKLLRIAQAYLVNGITTFDQVDAQLTKDLRVDTTLRHSLGMGVEKKVVAKGEDEVVTTSALCITAEEMAALDKPKPKAVELRTHNKLIGFSYEVVDDLFMINREYGISEAGNPYQGAWVCRNFHTGEYIDHDRHRHDLFERLNVKVA